MAKLTWTHQITQKKNFGQTVINQEMVLTVDYDPKELSIDVDKIEVFQNGVLVAEISKLLDNAEGDPLKAMIESIDWHQLYFETKADAVSYK